jgi:hypothetical protein
VALPDSRTTSGGGIDAGLELRLQSVLRRIQSQHEQLRIFAEVVASSVLAGSLRRARLGFMSFSDALDAHVTMEDRTVFPAVRGLVPELAPDLTQLVADHARFRDCLDALHDLLARGSAEDFSSDFASFRDEFAAHEAREERILRRVSSH